jgi:hypothetical protein
MHCFYNLHYRSRGNNLTVKSIHTIQGMRPRHYAAPFPILCWLFALLLALASATPVLHAQDWDHINGRDKVHDPTGAWLIRSSEGQFILTVFHEGGTLTGDTQGESAFDPASTNPPKTPFNVINSPESGVWHKTGRNTFAATFLTMEYQVDSSNNSLSAPLFEFDKVQFTGVLSDSGNQIELTALVTFFDANGNQLPPQEGIRDKANGVRIPLEVLPNTSHSLPIPPIPTAPVP